MAALAGMVSVLVMIVPVYTVKKPIRVVMKLSKKPVGNLNQPQQIKQNNAFYINTLNFPDGGKLEHPEWGDFGVKQNFYLDCTVSMQVKVAGKYSFSVGSDDGFRFWVNGKQQMEFVNGRPYAVNSCTVPLQPGTHRLRLLYYQGGGWLGLTFKYRLEDGPELFVGEDAPWSVFRRPGR